MENLTLLLVYWYGSAGLCKIMYLWIQIPLATSNSWKVNPGNPIRLNSVLLLSGDTLIICQQFSIHKEESKDVWLCLKQMRVIISYRGSNVIVQKFMSHMVFSFDFSAYVLYKHVVSFIQAIFSNSEKPPDFNFI